MSEKVLVGHFGAAAHMPSIVVHTDLAIQLRTAQVLRQTKDLLDPLIYMVNPISDAADYPNPEDALIALAPTEVEVKATQRTLVATVEGNTLHFSTGLNVITGIQGTGKSTVARGIISACRTAGLSVGSFQTGEAGGRIPIKTAIERTCLETADVVIINSISRLNGKAAGVATTQGVKDGLLDILHVLNELFCDQGKIVIATLNISLQPRLPELMAGLLMSTTLSGWAQDKRLLNPKLDLVDFRSTQFEEAAAKLGTDIKMLGDIPLEKSFTDLVDTTEPTEEKHDRSPFGHF